MFCFCFFAERINDTYYDKPLVRRDKGVTLSLPVQLFLKPWAPCAPPPCFLVVL